MIEVTEISSLWFGVQRFRWGKGMTAGTRKMVFNKALVAVMMLLAFAGFGYCQLAHATASAQASSGFNTGYWWSILSWAFMWYGTCKKLMVWLKPLAFAWKAILTFCFCCSSKEAHQSLALVPSRPIIWDVQACNVLKGVSRRYPVSPMALANGPKEMQRNKGVPHWSWSWNLPINILYNEHE